MINDRGWATDRCARSLRYLSLPFAICLWLFGRKKRPSCALRAFLRARVAPCATVVVVPMVCSE